MLFSTFLSLLLLFWIIVLLIDFYLRHSNSERYLNFLEEHRISFTPFQIRLYLTNSDRSPHLTYTLLKSIDRAIRGTRQSQILALWFTFGALISLLCFLLTPLYLFRLLLTELGTGLAPQTYVQHLPQLHESHALADPTSVLPPKHSIFYFPVREHLHSGITPIFPGINIPLSHMPIFVLVVILASIVHEAGHAVAAANANVRVTGLGVFLFAIYPGAFTEVEPDELDRCSCAQKLRIFGAGIWHNIMLALIGVLILVLVPVFSIPLYSRNSGIVVSDVDSKSGLYGPTGLSPGYQVERVNQCEVRNTSDWANCFVQIRKERLEGTEKSGYLAQFRAVTQMTASNGNIRAEPDGEVQCCQEFNVTTATHICFRYLAPIDKRKNGTKSQSLVVTPRPIFPNFPKFDAEFGVQSDGRDRRMNDNLVEEQHHLRKKRANLKMRFFQQTIPATEETSSLKTDSNGLPTNQEYLHACLPAMQITEHAICEFPSSSAVDKHRDITATLPPGYVCVTPALYNDTVLLRFQVKDLARPVLFIGYLNEPLHMVEISDLTPRFDLIPWWAPGMAELFARYLITLSLAMGILNAVPCYGLDGQFISTTVVDYFCKNMSQSVRKRVSNTLVAVGTLVFCANILIGFAKSLFY